jgi:hypothetical protein
MPLDVLLNLGFAIYVEYIVVYAKWDRIFWRMHKILYRMTDLASTSHAVKQERQTQR